ncbi:MAG: DUF1624 domain-containing protein [Schwartzia sp.]|nr:DUF1624 domain-containing protein [Schwartzia sp. (in: firmicutes)]
MESFSSSRHSCAAGRNIVLDVFRGLAVVVMIIVDAVPDYAAVYPVLVHTPWEGISVADTAFPSFVFAMGAAAAFSRNGPETAHRSGFWWGLLRRCGGLFLLGLLLNALSVAVPMVCQPDFDSDALLPALLARGRVFGVLQRLALTYALGMMIARVAKTEARIFVAAAALLLVSSAGYHLYNPEAPFAAGENISQAVDLIVPGAAHAYENNGLPFDPDGLYGTLGATASMLLGLMAGQVLRARFGPWQEGMLLAFGGGALMGVGWLWRGWDLVSKPLWTSPFALLNAGADMLLLAVLGWLLCLLPFFGALLRPFRAFGQNPLFFFFVTNLGLTILWAIPDPTGEESLYNWIWQRTVMDLGDPAFTATLFAVLWAALWWPAAEFLYRRGIVIKI